MLDRDLAPSEALRFIESIRRHLFFSYDANFDRSLSDLTGRSFQCDNGGPQLRDVYRFNDRTAGRERGVGIGRRGTPTRDNSVSRAMGNRTPT